MHEYSLAKNIIEIVTESAAKHNGKKVVEVVMEIGDLSGVMPEALKSALYTLVQATRFSETIFRCEKKKGKARCCDCGQFIEIEEFVTSCPHCQSFNIEIVQGKELNVKTITIE
jgi:hydrogenase nickel incorporation protein HypA/HybF